MRCKIFWIFFRLKPAPGHGLSENATLSHTAFVSWKTIRVGQTDGRTDRRTDGVPISWSAMFLITTPSGLIKNNSKSMGVQFVQIALSPPDCKQWDQECLAKAANGFTPKVNALSNNPWRLESAMCSRTTNLLSYLNRIPWGGERGRPITRLCSMKSRDFRVKHTHTYKLPFPQNNITKLNLYSLLIRHIIWGRINHSFTMCILNTPLNRQPLSRR